MCMVLFGKGFITRFEFRNNNSSIRESSHTRDTFILVSRSFLLFDTAWSGALLFADRACDAAEVRLLADASFQNT